jgi:hypothetical protein
MSSKVSSKLGDTANLRVAHLRRLDYDFAVGVDLLDPDHQLEPL